MSWIILCKGCDNLKEDANELVPQLACGVYSLPQAQHTRIGGCSKRTHNKAEVKKEDLKINPLKMSKRGIKQ